MPTSDITGSCPYLPDRRWHLKLQPVPPDDRLFQRMLNRQFRRWGWLAYRPRCKGCQACVPIRLSPETFRPSRSQRRCWRANAHIGIEVGACEPTLEKLALHDRYVESRFGPDTRAGTLEEYAFFYGRSPVSSREVRYYLEGALIGVAITDILPEVLSAVYTYWDPDHHDRGMGTFSILAQLKLTRQMDRKWLYLGYYIAGCPTMSYKTRFRPYQLMGSDGQWHTPPEVRTHS